MPKLAGWAPVVPIRMRAAGPIPVGVTMRTEVCAIRRMTVLALVLLIEMMALAVVIGELMLVPIVVIAMFPIRELMTMPIVVVVIMFAVMRELAIMMMPVMIVMGPMRTVRPATLPVVGTLGILATVIMAMPGVMMPMRPVMSITEVAMMMMMSAMLMTPVRRMPLVVLTLRAFVDVGVGRLLPVHRVLIPLSMGLGEAGP